MNDDHGGVRRLTKRARGAARAALFQTLWKRGYVLRRIDEGGWAPANVAKPGLAPKTLIDVGVGTGTVGLHEAFPAAHHVFVEPLPGFERDLKRLVAKFGGEYHLVAAGAEDGTAVFHLDRSIPMQSSLALPIDHEDRSLEEVEVTVARLDSLRERQGWKGPFGLKLDTEGHELEVIEGAPRLIEETEFVIAELSLTAQFTGQSSFAAFVARMDDHGFRLCDILTSPRSHEHEITQVDAMFRRTESTAG